MDAIQKMIDELNETAEIERNKFVHEEQLRINEQFKKAYQENQIASEKRARQQHAEAEKQYRQLSNQQKVASRQKKLSEKQHFLTNLFKEASAEMSNWSNDTFLSFVQNSLKKLILSGRVSLISGEYSSSYFTKAVIEALNQELPYQVILSERTLPKKAGFIIDDHGVQYNFIFEELVKSVEQEMRYTLMKRLFE